MVESARSSAAQDQGKSQCTCQSRTNLTTGVEEKARTQTFKPARGRRSLLFPETDRQLLVKVGRRLGRLPDIEQVKGRLEGGELLVAGSAGREMRPRYGISGRGRIEEEIR